MYVETDDATQRSLIYEAIKKAGSERKLKNAIGLPLISIYNYKNNIHRFTEEKFYRLIQYLSIDKNEIIYALVSPKEFQIKGGKATFNKHKSNGTFSKIHKKMREASSKRMKEWHKKMRENDPEKYFSIQHSRFKKIGKHGLLTKNKELVRNKLEQSIANFLFDLGTPYEYEAHIVCGSKNYFPDFKIQDTLLECTYWKGKSKAIKLLDKINHYESHGYKIFVIIPRRLASFYKPIQKNIIYADELKESIMPR